MRLKHKIVKAKNIKVDTWYFIPSERRYIYVDDVDIENDTTTAYLELGISNGLDEVALCFGNDQKLYEIIDTALSIPIAEYLQDNQALRASMNIISDAIDQIVSETRINNYQFDDIDFSTANILGAHQFLLAGVMQSYVSVLNDLADNGLLDRKKVDNIIFHMNKL